MAHCRHPHEDDLDRIEQTLRDLEPGAGRALRTYVNHRPIQAELDDPVAADWCRRGHDLSRLIEHGNRVKGIEFSLNATKRPWAIPNPDHITGTAGYYWVMEVVLSRRHLYIDDYLNESGVRVSMPTIAHIVQPSTNHIFVTIPAVGSPQAISDTIGRCFEAIFTAAQPGFGERHSVRHPWRRATTDARIDAQGLLSILNGLHETDPITIFAAHKNAS